MNEFIKWLKSLSLSDRCQESYVAIMNLHDIAVFTGKNPCSDDDFDRIETIFVHSRKDLADAGIAAPSPRLVYSMVTQETKSRSL